MTTFRSISPAYAAEARHNLGLAWPIIAAQLSIVGMGTVDAIMAGRLGARELAAVAVGSNLFFLLLVFFMGLFMAVSPIVAQRYGGGRAASETGAFLRGAMVLALLGGVAWIVIMRLISVPTLSYLNLDPVTYGFTIAYLDAVAWAGLPLTLSFVLRNGAEAHGLTRVPLLAGVAGLISLVIANDVLIYGKFGFPEFGVVGTAWGTVFASFVMLAVYVLAYARLPMLRALQIFQAEAGQTRAGSSEILRLGLPIALILTAEAGLFQVGGLLMARFGPEVMAAHQIAINFASLTFMVPLSIGLATTVRVGHAAGAGESAAVALRGRVGILLGACFAVVSAAIMVLIPRAVVGVYTAVPGVAQLAVSFLAYAAVFQIFDCIQATSNGALRGIKDTRLPMIITVAAYWAVGMPLAAWLAFATPVGPVGIWCGFIAGLTVAAAGLSYRFLSHTRNFQDSKRSVLMP